MGAAYEKTDVTRSGELMYAGVQPGSRIAGALVFNAPVGGAYTQDLIRDMPEGGPVIGHDSRIEGTYRPRFPSLSEEHPGVNSSIVTRGLRQSRTIRFNVDGAQTRH
jgi:hypothetical protein